jgi:putative transposase
MKRARFSEEQIIAVLKEAEGGPKVAELCRRHGISDATFLHLAEQVRRAGDLGNAPAAPARGGESTVEVDRRGPGARHSSAEGRTGKKRLRPAVKRQMVAEVMSGHGLSQRRACGLIGITRRGFRRAPGEDRNHLRAALRRPAPVLPLPKRCVRWPSSSDALQ